MMLTLTEAAEQTSKSKSTLTRAIKSGKLSATKNEHGDYRIDPAELFRVYKKVVNYNDSLNEEYTGPVVVSDLVKMLAAKDKEIAQVRAEMEEVREHIDDTEQRLNEHREAARALISPEDFKQQQGKWEAAMRARQEEIKQAREEASRISEKAAEDIATIERRAAKERTIREALESRGFIDRLLNRKPTAVG